MTGSFYSAAFSVLNFVPLAFGGIFLLFAGTYLWTWIRFHIDFRRFNGVHNGKDLKAPHLPIAVPWVGNAPAFLSFTPLKFWRELFSWYPRSAGACSITLGGNSTAVIFNQHATRCVMKDRRLGREEFNEQVTCNGLGLSKAEAQKYYEYHLHDKEGDLPGHVEQDKVNVEYLLKTDRVNEMTTEFIRSFRKQIADQFLIGPGETDLALWLRGLMFQASTVALMGTKILEVIPNLEELYFQFDQDMLSMFFGLPRFMLRKQLSNRDRTVAELVKWHEVVEKESSGEITDPDTVAWEPLYGSRVNRARQLFYKKKGITTRSGAALDLGMMFGISSNAIPATAWMLMHILDIARAEKAAGISPTLYDYTMAEVQESQNPDGTLNVATLINQPVLLSCLHEVLRVYVDVLVSRQVPNNLTLPLTATDDNAKNASRSLFCKKGSLIMIPTYPAHNNPDTWQNPDQPSPAVFYPYRFLAAAPKANAADKPVFSTAPYAGMYFPFGGGKTICPGRVFAKQEILGSVATLLLTFDFDVLGYVDSKGNKTDQFPGLKDALPGTAVMVPGGDLKVKITRR